MHPDLEKLLRLQEIELDIGKYTDRIEQLPRQMATLEAKLQGTIQSQQASKDQLIKLAAEKKKLETTIQDIELKISKYKSQLLDVKTNEQYKALLSEIDFGSQEIRKTEDDILARMEQEEKLKVQGRETETRLQQEKVEVEREKKSAEAEVLKDKGLLAELEQERKTLIESIPSDLYARYTRIASFRKGVAIARAVQETCQSCNVRIRPQIFSEVMRGEIIHSCDSCGRLLYYRPEAPYEVTDTPPEG